MLCPACQAQNDDVAQTCFTCGHSLVRSITRGTVVGSRYEILEPLGRGGMGMVYKAHDRALDETVALKVLRADLANTPDMDRRFRSEIKLARRVRHRNVCGIHEFGEDAGLRYIVMEFVDGTDLKQLLAPRRGLATDQAYEIAIQISEGLAAVHEVGIIHRDLKTANIMRDRAGRVMLMDFGIAKQAEGTLGATATGLVVGTPEYMSPEQARGEKVDFRSDLYALGIVIYEIFTGQVPFHGDTPVATILLHLQTPPPLEGQRAARLPPALRLVLQRALAKDRAERYASARELAEALRAARETSRSSLAPASLAAGAVALEMDFQEEPVPETTPGPPPGLATPVPAATARSLPAQAPTVSAPPPTVTPATPARREDRHAAPERSRARPSPFPPASPRRSPARRWMWTIPVVAAAAGAVLLARPRLARDAATASPPPTTVESVPRATLTSAAESRSADAETMPVDPVLHEAVTPPPAPSRQPVEPPRAAAPASPATTLPRKVRASPTAGPPLAAGAVAAPAAATPAATAPPAVEAPRAAPSPSPPTARELGYLRVVANPWAEVSVDGVEYGTTPFPRMLLPAGRHAVTLRHPAYEVVERTVTIRPGGTEVLRLDFTTEGVKKQ